MIWLVVGAVATAVTAGAVAVRSRRSPSTPDFDVFTVGEPWRQLAQGAKRAASRLHATIDAASDGPLKERMQTIGARLDQGLVETWEIARRGHQIDQTVSRLDPTGLRSKLSTLETKRDASSGDGADLDASISSVQSQIDATDRLKTESEKTANRLRLTQTRLDELVSRAAEVSVGAGDTDAYEHDVDDLVIELEGLRLAVEETNRS